MSKDITNTAGMILYTTILMSLLIGAIAINNTVMSVITDFVLTNMGAPNEPYMASMVFQIIFPVTVILGITAITSGVLKVFKTKNLGDLWYTCKKYNGVLYNILLLITLNVGFAMVEAQNTPIILLAIIAIVVYLIPGYLIINGLYKIAFQDIYMALKSDHKAKAVKV
jgi:hypothetical protein